VIAAFLNWALLHRGGTLGRVVRRSRSTPIRTPELTWGEGCSLNLIFSLRKHYLKSKV
jgi:hypothetical protein